MASATTPHPGWKGIPVAGKSWVTEFLVALLVTRRALTSDQQYGSEARSKDPQRLKQLSQVPPVPCHSPCFSLQVLTKLDNASYARPKTRLAVHLGIFHFVPHRGLGIFLLLSCTLVHRWNFRALLLPSHQIVIFGEGLFSFDSTRLIILD